MTETLDDLLARNKDWAARIEREDPGFFGRLSQQQAPEFLWIGCSDSRVPANQIIDMAPGEVFVHRNIANVVVHTDLNCLSVLQFAVDVLKVRHILVVGHYGCGGVHAALTQRRLGLADNWVRHVADVAEKHQAHLQPLGDEHAMHDRLCELNVLEQVVNVARTSILQDAWSRGQDVTVHAWCYRLEDGLVRDLGLHVDRTTPLADAYERALAHIESPERTA
ncbi:carbonate dehydratase [Lysobacter sp. HA35]